MSILIAVIILLLLLYCCRHIIITRKKQREAVAEEEGGKKDGTSRGTVSVCHNSVMSITLIHLDLFVLLISNKRIPLALDPNAPYHHISIILELPSQWFFIQSLDEQHLTLPRPKV